MCRPLRCVLTSCAAITCLGNSLLWPPSLWGTWSRATFDTDTKTLFDEMTHICMYGHYPLQSNWMISLFWGLVWTSGRHHEITSFRTHRGWVMSASQQQGQSWGQVTAGRSEKFEDGSRLRVEMIQILFHWVVTLIKLISTRRQS